MITFGSKGRDRITGFEGIVTGRAEYITGCNQVLLAPAVNQNGEFRESQWLDEQRIEQLPDDPVILDNGFTPGPDKQAPVR